MNNKELEQKCKSISSKIVDGRIEYSFIIEQLDTNKHFQSEYQHKNGIQYFQERNVIITEKGIISRHTFFLDEWNFLKRLLEESIADKKNITQATLKDKFSKKRLPLAVEYVDTHYRVTEELDDIPSDDELNEAYYDIDDAYEGGNIYEDPTGSYITDSVKLYLDSFRDYPLLTADEEHAIAVRIQMGDKKAREELINRNLRLVVWIAKKYIGCGLPLLDLIQHGNIGLMTAVDKFDANLGYRFSTYAVDWIKQSISRGIAMESRTIRIPVHTSEQAYRIRKVQRILEDQLNREPTNKEVLQYLKENNLFLPGYDGKMTENDVDELSMLFHSNLVSLNTFVGEEEDTELGDLIPDKADNPEQVTERTILQEDVNKWIDEVLNVREAEIVRLRYGIGKPYPLTLKEISKLYDMSGERVRQVLTKAQRKLKNSPYTLKHMKDYREPLTAEHMRAESLEEQNKRFNNGRNNVLQNQFK